MSHELRTPLNAIGGYAELMEMGLHGPVTAAQAAALERIQRSQRHLLGLINGVLNYARVDAGRLHYELADVPLDELLATCEALTAPQARARVIRVAFDGCAPTARREWASASPSAATWRAAWAATSPPRARPGRGAPSRSRCRGP